MNNLTLIQNNNEINIANNLKGLIKCPQCGANKINMKFELSINTGKKQYQMKCITCGYKWAESNQV